MAIPIRLPVRRRKRKRNNGVLLSAARWVLAFAGTLYLTWAVLLPASSGSGGRAIANFLFYFLGNASYVLLPLLFYGLALYFKSERAYWTWTFGALLTLFSSTVLFSALGSLVGRGSWGGFIGESSCRALTSSLGAAGAWLAALASGALGLRALFGISWWHTSIRLGNTLADDYKEWLRARRELGERIRSAAENLRTQSPVPAGVVPLPREEVVRPCPRYWADITRPVPAVAPMQTSAAISVESAPQVREVPRDTSPRTKNDSGNRRRASKSGTAGDFHLPPIDLLHPKSSHSTGGPEESEIRAAVENLDKTLASFDIQARVSGINPGPVITRYEVAPAPGVTVSSIVARANDIALAMKALRIRMIAPIPGKAAIGIEIPNQKSAGVTLREVLESPAMTSRQGPLSFAMGLSSDGAPVAADLQTLPHLLIAGATNSGKSVLVHSLIQSILFRARPDEVKFLLIDPKRIELSFYEGIPHLYDPKTPCEQVGVVTISKDAARSLKALIAVMENRYEKFQAYRARDIDGFNREAAKRGEPPEFYIVVVIDELADLMVVAKDVVEDSIQRLAQMARAVGIHLVLATQRPSVDVITGVIKANLPARVALRVASKVDSKVILDQNGAEALLGRGDMLYLSPGLEPARIQGSYVSTEEIARVVEYLKTQGKPDYPLLGTMAAVGEEDLAQYGVEPQEFRQALQLVLERRRVSQDLLKSQFGSSARATNLLSLLEVKGFIHKPEGTNRWEIYFERIEDYLNSRNAVPAKSSAPQE